jgi:tetratricopeptide (TPR) repeat protein
MKTLCLALALCFTLFAQDKPKQDPPPPPVLRGLMECGTHQLKNELEELGRVDFGKGAFSSDSCTAPEALKRIRAWVEAHSKPGAMAELKEAPQSKKAAALIGLAGAAAAGRHLSAAIAAFVEALALEPENATALANLAAALPTVGLCAEAIAIADLALAKTKGKLGPMGLPLAAVAHNARGFALLRQGKHADAVTALRQAVALGGPLASDAEMNLAFALLKTGEEEEAKRVFIACCWRRSVEQPVCYSGKTRKPGDPPPNPYEKGVKTRAPAPVLFDLSYGKPGKLPTFRHPQDVKQFKAFLKFYERESKEYLEYMQKYTLWVQSQKNLTPGDTLSDKRALKVLEIISTINVDPDLVPLWDAMEKGGEEFNRQIKKIVEAGLTTTQEIIKAGGKGVQAKLLEHTNSLLNQANGPCEGYDMLVRKYWELARKYESGLAANIKTPYWHDRAEWRIRADTWTMWYGRLLGRLHLAYSGVYGAGGSPSENAGTLEVPEKAGPDDEETPKCPSGLQGSGVEIEAGPLSVSFSCESMGVELSTEGPLKGFVSFETTWEGKMTVYAGAKLELDAPGPLPGLTVQDGIYITGDKNGVTDVGARVGFEAFKEVGGVKVKTTLDQMDFSLMPRVN